MSAICQNCGKKISRDRASGWWIHDDTQIIFCERVETLGRATPRDSHSPAVSRISHLDQLRFVASVSGMRFDWHEPDEQGISARIIGNHLDNAMGSCIEGSSGEFNVVLMKEGQDFAVINLATLLAWATNNR